MRQLVELGKNAEQFKKTKTEVIAVFREESQGEDGLKKIQQKTGTEFTLALDTGKKQTGRYSSGKGEFTGYVIDPKGKITKIIKGNLLNRAKSKELLAAIGSLSPNEGSEKAGSSRKSGSGSKGS